MSDVWFEPGKLTASPLRPPPSKSHALRALCLSHALQIPPPELPGELPRDVRVLQDGLNVLRTHPRGGTIDCRDGGAPFRFLLAQAAITPGADLHFVGAERLGERPHQPLLTSLQEALGPAGLKMVAAPTFWPLRVHGASERAPEPVFRVDGEKSSQFASALALAAAALAHREGRAWTVWWTGRLASPGYLSLTADLLREHGVPVAQDGAALVISPATAPHAGPAVPADWSSAAYLLLLSWRSGAKVLGLDLRDSHPDRAIVEHLRSVGLRVNEDAGGVSVSGEAHGGLSASAKDTPDLIPTLAALALVLDQPSTFTDVEVLRAKESDRVQGIIDLVRAFGGRAELFDEGLRVFPAAGPSNNMEVELDACGDHRRVLTAITASALTGVPVRVLGAQCVEKSFPDLLVQLFGAIR